MQDVFRNINSDSLQSLLWEMKLVEDRMLADHMMCVEHDMYTPAELASARGAIVVVSRMIAAISTAHAFQRECEAAEYAEAWL